MRLAAAFWVIFSWGLISFGCAPAQREVDTLKSCEALFYESESIDFQLATSKDAAEKAKDKSVPLHIFVVSVGAALSVAPLIAPAAVSGGSAYIMPSLTAGYYNRFVAPKEIIDRNDYLEERREILDRLLEDRECKQTTKR
jgi:hypothetical protein